MTSGFDDGKDDPDRTTSSGDWWKGAPEPGSPWESHPLHPVQPPGPPRQGPPQQGPPQQGPWQSGGPVSGAPPYQSGANPFPPVQNPPTGPGYPSGANPYASGPGAYRTAQQPPRVPPFTGYPPTGGGGGGGGGGRGRGRVWLFVGIGALVVVIAVVLAVVFVNQNSGSSAQSTSTTTAPATTTTPYSATTAPATTTPAAIIPGYQVVVPNGVKAAWDVPADWKIDQTATGFGTGADAIPVNGLATEGDNYCPNYTRTNMFLTLSDKSDAAAAAADVGARMAKVGWSTRTSTNAGAAQPFSSTDGKLNGVYLETSGAFTPPDPSCASSYSVYTFAVSSGTQSLVLTIAADTGVDRSVNADFARRLLATFRLF
ncbi:hypothetical protein [Nocardia sp. NPDC020380]|uniref:hypothetical protein n=1 Tax=Nocardia sp. NPDC020380 TaxID=3364309 RepID=UPI0037B5D66A